MDKLPMCRICLVQNVHMYVVGNKNLHELYEKLTDIPFVTDDSRPILVCFVCCAQLKKCYRLLTKCLEAEERFTQIINGNYEPKPLINHNDLEFFHGLCNSPIQSISIVENDETESIAVKEELQAVCEGLDDVIEPNEEYSSDDDGKHAILVFACIQCHHVTEITNFLKHLTSLFKLNIHSTTERAAKLAYISYNWNLLHNQKDREVDEEDEEPTSSPFMVSPLTINNIEPQPSTSGRNTREIEFCDITKTFSDDSDLDSD